MKIFQIITVSEFGGAQTVVANLVEKLKDNNTVYILFGGEGEAWEHIKSNVNLIKISEHRKQISLKDIALAIRLFKLRLKYKPDIVHLHSSKMGAIGRLVFDPKTVVYTVHGFDSIRKGFRKFLFVEKLLKSRAAKIVGVSQYDIDGLNEEGISGNVGLVYNGVIDHSQDKKEWSKDDSVFLQLEEIKQLPFTHIAMCISRISAQKKFDLFLDIAELRKNVAFVWIGNKSDISDLPSNVFCLGEAQSAYDYLRYADVFILPSNYEGLPMSLLEALSFGVPVIASAVGGISEVLDGSNGFAVENEPFIFAEKIDYVLDKDINERMRINARNSYLKNFTIDKMSEGYEKIYNTILEERKR